MEDLYPSISRYCSAKCENFRVPFGDEVSFLIRYSRGDATSLSTSRLRVLIVSSDFPDCCLKHGCLKLILRAHYCAHPAIAIYIRKKWTEFDVAEVERLNDTSTIRA